MPVGCSVPLLDRDYVMARVRVVDGCWEWRGAVSSSGYGNINLNPGTLKAHRVAFRIFHGKDPKEKLVLHTCDNRLCCNPAHLFLGTNQDNMTDMTSKGRSVGHPCGCNPNARLTADDVAEIRAVKSGYGVIKKLSQEFGVSKTQIHRIRSSMSWNGGR